MKTLNALTVRKRFGSVLDEVVRKREPITITRGNQPLVVLVPAEDYRAGPDGGRDLRLRRAAERVADWRRRHATRLGDLDPVALVRRTRASR